MLFTTSTLSILLSLTTFVSKATAQDTTTAKLNWTGKLSSLDGGLGGTVTVTSPNMLTITDYKLEDASAPALYWWGSKTGVLSEGFRISNAQVKMKASSPMLEIALDDGKTPADFTTVGLWCERLKANFGQTTLAEGSGTMTTTASATMSSASAPAAATTMSSAGESVKMGLKSVVAFVVTLVAGGMGILLI